MGRTAEDKSYDNMIQAIRALTVKNSQTKNLNPILPRGGGGEGAKYVPPPDFPQTAQGIKLKLSDFKDTPLRHILQVKAVR